MAAPFELGKLLRVQAMVTAAAQTQAATDAARALVRSYSNMRAEVLEMLAGDDLRTLREECERLFPEMQEPSRAFSLYRAEDTFELAAVASDALLRIRTLGGWIQGLIDEQTFERRIQAEAEAKARLAQRPTGFSA